MKPREPHWLLARAAEFAGREAILYGGDRLSYERLSARIEEWARIIERMDLPPGAVVGIGGTCTGDACALLLALAGNGYVAALLPSGSEDAARYLGLARGQAVIECADTGAWSWSRLTPTEPPVLLQRLRERDMGGLIVFSSGTTGESKAGLFDFAALTERYRKRRRGWRTILFLQLDHMGGIHTMLHTLAHGGTLVITRARDPEAVCRAIERHRIELLPASPTFLRMLAISGAHRHHDLSSLQLITYGTEPMPASTLAALATIFPAVEFKQTYGLSELGVLPSRSKATQSLWLEIGGVGCDIRVVDGVLWIRSETAMLGYLNAPSPFDEDGWYNTEDAVEVDGRYLRILGRTSDLINVGGQKVYPAEIEDVLLKMDNVRDATVWGRANPVTSQIVAARLSLAEPEDRNTLEQRVRDFCSSRLAGYKIPLWIEVGEADHHGRRFKKLRPREPIAQP